MAKSTPELNVGAITTAVFIFVTLAEWKDTVAAPKIDIDGLEQLASKVIGNGPVHQAEADKLAAYFGSILTGIFQEQEKESSYKGWCVDDLWAQDFRDSSKKVSLSGPVSWLVGGGEIKRFQLDIAKNEEPLLYSYKLNNKHSQQIMYVGKTRTEWVIRS